MGVHLGAGARPWSSPPTTSAEVERYATRVLLLADGELLFTGTPRELEQAVGGDPRDLEAALVSFLHQRGH